jgi:dephospho-CoA kinase
VGWVPSYDMLVIGLIGGIASGKSFVAKCFSEEGAEILNADQIGHGVLEITEVVNSIRDLWPETVDSTGRVDRKMLAETVFRSPGHQENLKKLESLVHPLISERIDERFEQLSKTGCQAVVLDAPVLIEAGWNSKCNKVVFVEAPFQVRKTRALARGWEMDELEKREKSQLSLEEKRAVSTDIVHNGNSKEETRKQVSQLWMSWGLRPSQPTLTGFS